VWSRSVKTNMIYFLGLIPIQEATYFGTTF